MSEQHEHAEIGARLVSLRKNVVGLTQRDWASKLNVGGTQLNSWETGFRRIPVEQAEKLCDLYGVTLDWIYRGRVDGLPQTLLNKL